MCSVAWCMSAVVVPIERMGGGKNLAELRERLSPYVSRLRRDEVLDLPPIAINDYALTVWRNR